MKVLFKFSIVLLGLMLNAQSADAQLLKKLKKGIKDKMENIGGEKGDRESSDDKKQSKDQEVEAQKEMQNESPKGINLEGLMGGMLKEAKTEDSYSFDVLITMRITDHSKKKNEITEMIQGFGSGSVWSEMPGSENGLIYDLDNNSMIVLDENKKTAQALSIDMMNMMKQGNIAETNNGESHLNVKRTGRTKDMHNYRCEEYLITHQDGKMEAWFAPDVNFDYKDFAVSFSKMFETLADESFPSDKGYVMHMKIYNEKGNLENEMEVIEFSENELKIDMSKYEIQKMF